MHPIPYSALSYVRVSNTNSVGICLPRTPGMPVADDLVLHHVPLSELEIFKGIQPRVTHPTRGKISFAVKRIGGRLNNRCSVAAAAQTSTVTVLPLVTAHKGRSTVTPMDSTGASHWSWLATVSYVAKISLSISVSLSL